MSYLSAVLADSPVHYWRCAETGGSILHDIGSSPRHLGFQAVTPNVLGYSGIAADGGSVWVDAGFGWFSREAELSVSPFSLEMWVWIVSNTQSVRFLFDFGGDTNSGMDIALSAADHFGADWNAGHITGNAATPQAWHHVVCTYANPNLNLYVDAINQGSVVVATAGGLSTPHLGTNNALVQAFSAGALCEAAVYHAALTPTQINNHFVAAEYNGPPVWGGTGLMRAVGSSSLGFDESVWSAILNSVRRVF